MTSPVLLSFTYTSIFVYYNFLDEKHVLTFAAPTQPFPSLVNNNTSSVMKGVAELTGIV